MLIAVGSILCLGAKSCLSSSDSDEIAVLDGIGVSPLPELGVEVYRLYVDLTPTSVAQANHTYVVDLYEKGRLRASISVSWTQPQINVREVAEVYFPLSEEEGRVYSAAAQYDFATLFSIKVHD